MAGFRKQKNGFTIVELTISIAFISVLSVIVLLIINNAVAAYHRGITLNQLNTTGMDLVDDMRAAIQTSPGGSLVSECEAVYDITESSEGNKSALDKCRGDGGMSFAVIERQAKVKVGSDKEATVPVYGAFCTGAYSYVWNSGYLFNEEDYVVGVSPITLVYEFEDAETGETGFRPESGESPKKLLKIKDSNRAVCKAAAGATEGEYLTQEEARGDDGLSSEISLACEGLSDVCGRLDEKGIDVLANVSSLALYDLTVARPAESGNSGNVFYAVSFILGTIQGGVNINAGGNYCATPEGFNAEVENFDYCAINKFNFAAQATGRK